MGWGEHPTGTGSGTQNRIFADLGKNVLPEAPPVFPSPSHSQACFNAENNNENFLPRGGLCAALKALMQALASQGVGGQEHP